MIPDLIIIILVSILLVSIYTITPKPKPILVPVFSKDKRLCPNREYKIHTWTKPSSIIPLSLSISNLSLLQREYPHIFDLLTCSLICKECGYLPHSNLMFDRKLTPYLVKYVEEVINEPT